MLRVATIHGAEAIGLVPDIGSLPAQSWQHLDPVAPAAGITGTGGAR